MYVNNIEVNGELFTFVGRECIVDSGQLIFITNERLKTFVGGDYDGSGANDYDKICTKLLSLLNGKNMYRFDESMIGFNTGGDLDYPVYKNNRSDIFIPITLMEDSNYAFEDEYDNSNWDFVVDLNDFSHHGFEHINGSSLIVIDPCYIKDMGNIDTNDQYYYDTNNFNNEISIYTNEENEISCIMIWGGN